VIASLARGWHSALTLLALPWRFAGLWWRGREHRGYRLRWHERLALGGPRAQPGAVWVHARTLGEVKVAAVLVGELRRFNPSWRYLLTHGEAEGRAEGYKLLKPGDVQAWLPFDTRGAARRFLRRHQPRVGVLMERLTHPNLLHRAALAGVPMMMANARLGDADLKHAQRRRALLEPGFQGLALVLAQSDADARRLAQVGAQQVRVFGNLRFDVEPPVKLIARGLEWRQAVGRPVVLAAGTLKGEEEPLLDAWRALPAPRPLLVVVPRHAKRLARVAFEVRERGLVLKRRSAWGPLPPTDVLGADVWLGDTRGEMAMYYGMADVALLGGSFGKDHGGQNLIEAAACGCPVLLGPHTSEHENVAGLAIAAGAAERVADLRGAVARAARLAGDPRRDAWVRNAFAFTAAHRGTVNRVVGALLALMSTRPVPADSPEAVRGR
jgi:3-deoxy-D-manno-octulosonic-acid transferase